MRKLLLLGLVITSLCAGCSTSRGPAWLIKVESSPPGARIFGIQGSGSPPGEYLGTAPCYAPISANEGGWLRETLTLTALPPTNNAGLHPQTARFEKSFGSRTKLPNALFFDLSKPAAPQPE